MAGRFAEQVVLLTGGSSGLGLETAELFLQEGAKLFIVDLEERDVLKKLGCTDKAHFQKCDTSSPEDCEKAVKSCVEKFGRLVNPRHCIVTSQAYTDIPNCHIAEHPFPQCC